MSQRTYDRRLIEDSLPLEVISEQSAREKSIRHGHISTLHIWWARRPLAAMRAAIFASLIPAPKDDAERHYLHALIKDIVNWDAVKDGNNARIEEARALIRQHYPDAPPKVLDPFMGGGSIALEALRLGSEVQAVDMNPVAYLIGMGTLVYPQKYGEQLAKDVERWGNVVLERVLAEFAPFYRNSDIGLLWTYEIDCPNTTCGARIPLLKDNILAYNRGKESVVIHADFHNHREPRYELIQSDVTPSKQTDKNQRQHGRNISCPVCGSIVDHNYVRSEAAAGRVRPAPVARITQKDVIAGFAPVDETDGVIFEQARRYLDQKRAESPNIIPNDPIGTSRNINLPSYGIDRWSELFNARQLLLLVLFMEHTREVYNEILTESHDMEYARALLTYLAFAIDNVADGNSIMSRWNAQLKKPMQSLRQSAFAMAWDYIETFPSSRSIWQGRLENMVASLRNAGTASQETAQVILGDATALDDLSLNPEFDLIVADPPYFGYTSTNALSGIFSVLLKRTLGDKYPDTFDLMQPASSDDAATTSVDEQYHDFLKHSLAQIEHRLKLGGLAVLLFPYHPSKSLDDVFEEILSSGLDVTALVPLRTESMSHVVRLQVASTLLVVARKQVTQSRVDGRFIPVRAQIRLAVRHHLESLPPPSSRDDSTHYLEAVSVALQVLSHYHKVLDPANNHVPFRDMLRIAQDELTDYLLLTENR